MALVLAWSLFALSALALVASVLLSPVLETWQPDDTRLAIPAEAV